MAAMLSISLNPNISASISLHSIFKGNSRNLRPNSLHIIPIRTRQRPEQETRCLVVVNQAVKSTQVPVQVSNVRFRLDNLGPQPGSRKKGKRKGRGISAGQGGSCGFGMRGQKSRSGPGVRKGFEGGQMPLYRRIPKLRGIAGGMHAGLPKYILVNLKDIETAGFRDGDEVSLETLTKRGLINPSGRDRKLPLKGLICLYRVGFLLRPLHAWCTLLSSHVLCFFDSWRRGAERKTELQGPCVLGICQGKARGSWFLGDCIAWPEEVG
ncbi:hypothetical protein ES319_D11G384800v1 [Gossypium barbadense]|uniref:Uncharacterized protein n=2 Tax=Gossypium TaxID=3633 RepID=A0A5J5PP60_GOSBA|nr:hypothetical protein ES319_D11G384800v1 [Gossypium barbadense]TYG48205.1 hypothetical protein ES288_D11G404800v1 [Gossypium darwinii]